jgi:uncharacterized protein
MCSIKDFDIDILLEEIKPVYEGADPAHDFSHAIRVWKNARAIGIREGADMQVLLLASLLHDAGSESKHIEVSEESDSNGQSIVEALLQKSGFSKDVTNRVLYAIEVHRFSKGLLPSTLEARVLQDADRLDALGAIGIARVFMTGGRLGRALYSPSDPFCTTREPDDMRWNLDHFYRKLLKLESGMHTKTAKLLAKRRATVLRRYLSDLHKEIEEDIDAELDEMKVEESKGIR